jgi:hypothetical protein
MRFTSGSLDTGRKILSSGLLRIARTLAFWCAVVIVPFQTLVDLFPPSPPGLRQRTVAEFGGLRSSDS